MENKIFNVFWKCFCGILWIIILLLCVLGLLYICLIFTELSFETLLNSLNKTNRSSTFGAIGTYIAAAAAFFTAYIIYSQIRAAKREFSLTSIQNAFFSLYNGERLKEELKYIEKKNILAICRIKKNNIPTFIGILDLLRLNCTDGTMYSKNALYYIRLLFRIVKKEKHQENIFKIYARYLCLKNTRYSWAKETLWAKKNIKDGYSKFLKQVAKALDKSEEWKKYIDCFNRTFDARYQKNKLKDFFI